MEISIKEETEDKLLGRKKLIIEINHPKEATISKQNLQKYLAERYNVDISKVNIKYIMGEKGKPVSKAKAYIQL